MTNFCLAFEKVEIDLSYNFFLKVKLYFNAIKKAKSDGTERDIIIAFCSRHRRF